MCFGLFGSLTLSSAATPSTPLRDVGERQRDRASGERRAARRDMSDLGGVSLNQRSVNTE
jgi:hypothetical protein